MRSRLSLGFALVALSCSRAPEVIAPREEAPIAPAPVAAVSAAPSANAAAPTVAIDPPAPPADPTECDPTRAPKVLSKIPCVEQTDSYLHERTMGYSKDGRYLGFCISTCDPCPTECTFTDGPSRARVKLDFYSTLNDPVFQAGKISEDEARKRGDAIDARHQKFLVTNAIPKITTQRVLHGPWRWDDVVFESRTSTSETTGKAIVELGGSVDGGPAFYPMRVEVGPHSGFSMPIPKGTVPPSATADERKQALANWRAEWALDPRLAVVDVTPDGKEIGVVAFAHGAMWFEAAEVARMPASAFAARVYDESAKAAKASGDAAKAEALAAKAKAARDAK
jgi:hypothetical protein